MPHNLTKEYPDLLEIAHYKDWQRKESLLRIFKRDIEDNLFFKFRSKEIRPTKKEGEIPMETLYEHLTTRKDKDEEGNEIERRSFEMDRSIRLHWVKVRITESKNDNVQVFSYEDRIKGKDVIRTYILDMNMKYVVILEPQRSKMDYYLITAYYLNEPGSFKQMKKKSKNRLEELY